MKYLTKAERETVITMNDADTVAHIATHQRSLQTKLRRNPAVRVINEEWHGENFFGEYEIPVGLISFRTRFRTKDADDG